ncbi:Aste57867_9721 [Aphanomyces stellatus]|uniref:Aste57867_9721 protein n=1 Tax=Aphanomyces stellatus TaxID=120398 RepID=A0A485KNW9_9STRA|nr:hypothetical protein As57867_009683 [Aphanomyces stellatus]VFT86600.1 Aste57867_9721 [Aphanomyces stellatus]
MPCILFGSSRGTKTQDNPVQTVNSMTITLDDILSPSAWVSKKVRLSCADCGLKFHNLFRRRHHCRLCGDLFCKQCVTRQRLALLPQETQIKICRCCALTHDVHKTSPSLLSSTQSTTATFGRKSASPKKAIQRGVMTKSSHSCRGRLISTPLPHITAATKASPTDERNRPHAVRRLKQRGSADNSNVDILCDLAASATHCPMAIVSLVDDTTQYLEATMGLPHLLQHALPRTDASLCAHVVATGRALVVLDTKLDPRFRHAALVQHHGVRFYAGVPLVDDDGNVVGTLAVLDVKPRRGCDIMPLQAMANGVVATLNEDKPNEGILSRLEANAFYETKATSTLLDPNPQPTEDLIVDALLQATSMQATLTNQQSVIARTVDNHSYIISRLSQAIERLESKLTPDNL